jgi:hypothetical protein
MADNARLDDELAAFTDSLLAGEEAPVPAELSELAAVVRQLHTVIDPQARPTPVFEERLTQRLNREWTIQHERRPQTWRSYRLTRLAALAAALAVILVGVALLSSGGDNEPVQGTAIDSTIGTVAVLVALVGLGILVLIWLRQRRL